MQIQGTVIIITVYVTGDEVINHLPWDINNVFMVMVYQAWLNEEMHFTSKFLWCQTAKMALSKVLTNGITNICCKLSFYISLIYF